MAPPTATQTSSPRVGKDANSSNQLGPPTLGMSFDSMTEAKEYIVAWCAQENIPYLVFKADRRAWVLTCKDKNNCSFRLRVKNIDSPTISVFSPHTCSPLSYKKTAPTGGPISAKPYNWPHEGSFTASTTAFVIIDMQNDCMFRSLQLACISSLMLIPANSLFACWLS